MRLDGFGLLVEDMANRRYEYIKGLGSWNKPFEIKDTGR